MEPILTSDEVQLFREQGFLSIPRLASAPEVEQLRGIFERLFAKGSGWRQGMQFDLAGTDETVAKLPQILKPSRLAPELETIPLRTRALDLARQLLGPEVIPWSEHAILKPPQYGAATPWHQDEAHRSDEGTAYEQISIWIPLREATEANGCMKYIAASHRGAVLPHRSPGDDPRIMALECVGEFDPAAAKACPLPAGGAVVHHGRTIHGAGPNRSDTPRPAYILAFRGPPSPAPEFTGYAWNLEKRTAAQERARSWQTRGGVIGRGSRKMLRLADRAWRRFGHKARRLLGRIQSR